MAQTKLNTLISLVSKQIGDTSNVVYSTSEVLSAINEARRAVYNKYYSAITTSKTALSELDSFAEYFSEWVRDTSSIITAITGTTTLTITTKYAHRLIAGDSIKIAGVTGFGTNPNGNFTVVSVVSDNKITITHTVVSGSYASGGTIDFNLSANQIRRPADCKAVIKGMLNSSSPAVVNAMVSKIIPERYFESKYDIYSPFYADSSGYKMYEKPDYIELLGIIGTTYTGTLSVLYLSSPIDISIDSTIPDIPDPDIWINEIGDYASNLILSYQLT